LGDFRKFSQFLESPDGSTKRTKPNNLQDFEQFAETTPGVTSLPGQQVASAPNLSERITQAQQETPGRIAERGTIQQELGERFKPTLPGQGKPGFLRQAGDIALAGLSAASVPTQAIESGISNIALGLQKEDKPSLGELATEGLKGVTLQKRGRFEDVFRGAGLPETPAKLAGIATSLAVPIGIANKAKRAFGTLSKASDKGIAKASQAVIRSTDEAANIIGPKVDAAFEPVKNMVANRDTFTKSFSVLPKVIKKKASEVFGDIDDFAGSLNVGKLREFKRWLGQLKPAAFGKEAKGAVERIDDININQAFSGIKKLIGETIETSIGGPAGKKASKLVLDAEERFTELKRATQFLRKTVVDSTLQVPTKGGALARKISKEGDLTSRTAINIIKKAGGDANKTMNKAIDALNKFNRAQDVAQLFKRIISGATIGAGLGVANRLLPGGGEEGGGFEKGGSDNQ